MRTDRRRFLKILGGAGAASVAPACGGGDTSGPPHAKSIAVGQIVAMPTSYAFVARDAGGLYAMSSVCTHENCDMRNSGGVSGMQITCSCHGSRFDATGNVVAGPAKTALAHHPVTIQADGTVFVDTNKTVPAATRTMV